MKILFIGTYLAHIRGSKDVTESLALNLETLGYHTKLSSKKQNRFFRAIEITLNIIFFKGNVVIFDLYSGKSIYITYLGLLISKFLRFKTVIVLHGGGLADAYSKNDVILNKLFRLASKLVSPSNFLINFFGQHGFQINYIPNSIKLEDFTFIQKPNLEHKLLWVRAFSPTYNPELTIHVLEKVKAKFPETKLSMIGPDFGKLVEVKELIREKNLESSVTIVGPIPNRELNNYFHSHDVYLNTTSYESFGMALMEAGASGTPIVSTAVGEIPLIWKNNENIILCENDLIENFCAGISRIFSEPDFKQKLIDNARKNANNYTWNKVQERWRKLINELHTLNK